MARGITIGYIDLECPDYGKLKVDAHLVLGAIEVYAAKRNDPSKAFLEMLATLVPEDIADLDGLTEADLDVVAGHYSKDLQAYDEYHSARQNGDSPTRAFSIAFEESKIWKEMAAHIRRATVDIGRAWNWVAAAHASEFLQLYRPYQEFLLQTRSILWPNVDMATKLNEVSVKMLSQFLPLQTLYEQSRVLSSFTDILSRWRDYSASVLSQWAAPSDLIRRYRQNWAQLSNRMATIAELAESAKSFHDQMVSTLDLYQHVTSLKIHGARSAAVEAIFESAQAAAEISGGLVRSANQYFAGHPGVGSTMPGTALLRKVKDSAGLSQVREADARLVSGLRDSEQIVCGQVAATIRLSNGVTGELLIDKSLADRLSECKPLIKRVNALVDRPQFLQKLREFGDNITRKYREVFWQQGGRNFRANPEQIAKVQLGNFLDGAVGDFAFVGREINAGPGFVDILVNFLGDDYVVEMKMVGGAWPIGWAESGVPQLDAYMEDCRCSESYLVVFDGRKTTRGRQLEETYALDHGQVHVVVSRIHW